MAWVGKALRPQLVELAEDLGIAVGQSWNKNQIKKAIIAMEGYDEEFAKGVLEGICDREEKERDRQEKERDRQEIRDREEKERDRQEKERDRQEIRDREEKERDRQETRDREERDRQEREKERERAFELERLRITNESTIRTSTPVALENLGRRHVPDMKRMMPNFNVEETDISLYLTIFERQLTTAQVEEDLWSSQLLALLPIEVGRIILQETAEAIPEYQVAKQLLLDRYRLTPEAFRQKFVQHVRKGTARWKDFAFELKGYVDGWLKGLNITTFEQLKDLMIADQLKRKAGTEARSHFIDIWSEVVSPWTLAEKLDKYELVRPSGRSSSRENERVAKPSKTAQEFGGVRKSEEKGGWRIKAPEENGDRRNASPQNSSVPTNRNADFEKRKLPQCFNCGSEAHFKVNCPFKDKREGKEASHEECNHVGLYGEKETGEEFKLSPGRANGDNCSILRDTGSSIDLVSQKYAPAHSFTGGYVLLKQPLDRELKRLPLARVKLEGEFGSVMTQAAVFGKSLDQGRYIMGNRTAALIARHEKNNDRGAEFSNRPRSSQVTMEAEIGEGQITREGQNSPFRAGWKKKRNKGRRRGVNALCQNCQRNRTFFQRKGSF